MRQIIPLGFVFLAALGLTVARAAEEKPTAAPRWEYRVLTKDQVLDLGKITKPGLEGPGGGG